MAGFDAGKTAVQQVDFKQEASRASIALRICMNHVREGGLNDKLLHFRDVRTYFDSSRDHLVLGGTDHLANGTVERFRVDGCRSNVHELER
jgi:hypothetical protein